MNTTNDICKTSEESDQTVINTSTLTNDATTSTAVELSNISESTNTDTYENSLVPNEKANSSVKIAEDQNKKRLVRKGPKEYKSVNLKPQGNSTDFYKPENIPKIIAAINTILVKEAPIEYSYLRSKVLNAWGFNRSSAKLDNYFKELLEQITTNSTLDSELKFIWKADQNPNTYTVYRSAGNRSIREIPSQEIINAAYIALKENGSMDKQDLLREVAKRFDCSKFTKSIESYISLAIEKALVDNTLKALGNGKIAR